MIKEALLSGRKLTSLEALECFGCSRLASRIHELKMEGLNIICENKKLPNGKRVGEYRLEFPKGQGELFSI